MKHLLETIDRRDAAPSLLRNYALAFALACFAAVMTKILRDLTGLPQPFLLGLGAVMISAWIGGAGPALIASALMIFFGLLIAPNGPSATPTGLLALTLFAIILSLAGEWAVRVRRSEASQRWRLAQHEIYLQSLFDALPAAMMVIDKDGRILAINNFAVQLLFIDDPDDDRLYIQDFLDLPNTTHSLVDRLSAIARRGATVTAKQGLGEDLALTIAAARLEPTNPDLLTLYLRDETTARAAAETLAQMQTNVAQLGRAAALGTMGSAIAHELNQPLASAANYAGAARSFLARRPDDTPQAVAAVEATIEQIVRAGEILKGLRTFVRAAPASPQWLDIRLVVGEAAQLGHFLLNDMRVILETDIAHNARYVWCDRVQIQQVLVNLLNNAAEALADREVRVVRITAWRAGDDQVELGVADTGGGVSPEIRDRLFEPFQTTKGKGLGIGLAICRSIIEAHGGRIWYEDTEQGARFCLTLKHSHQPEGGDAEWQDQDLHHRRRP